MSIHSVYACYYQSILLTTKVSVPFGQLKSLPSLQYLLYGNVLLPQLTETRVQLQVGAEALYECTEFSCMPVAKGQSHSTALEPIENPRTDASQVFTDKQVDVMADVGYCVQRFQDSKRHIHFQANPLCVSQEPQGVVQLVRYLIPRTLKKAPNLTGQAFNLDKGPRQSLIGLGLCY